MKHDLKALKAANSMVPPIATRNTATLATQNTGHGEPVLGDMYGKVCTIVVGDDMIVDSAKSERFPQAFTKLRTVPNTRQP